MEKIILINGQETNYTVSEEGIIKNRKTQRELSVKTDGSIQLTINGKGKHTSVRKLVAEAFVPNPNNYLYVINIDGNKLNNHVENIKWISGTENANNTWSKRRENGTINNSGEGRPKNIVGRKDEKGKIEPDEKRIILDGIETSYVINPHGRVRNLRTNRELKGSILHSYQYINFRQDGLNKNKAVHILVAEAFIPNPENKPFVDHIDGNRLNNDISNLRWATEKENAQNKHLDKTPEKPVFKEVIFTEEEIKNEVWKNYKDTEYLVSNLGRVKGKQGKVLQGYKSDCGYIKFHMSEIKKLGHVLVWETFVGKKNLDKVINHINGNKHDNRLINLEEVTHKENMQKAANETNAWNFRKVGEYNDNDELLNVYLNASDAARAIGILPSSMRNTIRRNGKCFNGLKYRYID